MNLTKEQIDRIRKEVSFNSYTELPESTVSDLLDMAEKLIQIHEITKRGIDEGMQNNWANGARAAYEEIETIIDKEA